MKCHNCSKNAMYVVGDQQVPLCLDCYIRFQDMNERQLDSLERQMNYLSAQMESSVGMPGILPRYPERRRVIHTGQTTLNNFNVSNSQIGVLNTGTIQNVDATVTVLRTGGESDLATALTELAQAVISDSAIVDQTKNQILELLNELAEQAVAPNEKRKPAVARAILAELGSILGGIESLSNLWDKFKSVLGSALGF